MTKKDFDLLGKIFAAEISGLLPYQSRSARYRELEKAGMVEFVEYTLGGLRPPVTVKGWVLTQVGRMEYCKACSEKEMEGSDE